MAKAKMGLLSFKSLRQDSFTDDPRFEISNSSSHLLNLFCFKGGDVLDNQVLNGDVHVDDVLAEEGCDGDGDGDLTQCGECQSEELQKGPKAEFQGLGCLVIL